MKVYFTYVKLDFKSLRRFTVIWDKENWIESIESFFFRIGFGLDIMKGHIYRLEYIVIIDILVYLLCKLVLKAPHQQRKFQFFFRSNSGIKLTSLSDLKELQYLSHYSIGFQLSSKIVILLNHQKTKRKVWNTSELFIDNSTSQKYIHWNCCCLKLNMD